MPRAKGKREKKRITQFDCSTWNERAITYIEHIVAFHSFIDFVLENSDNYLKGKTTTVAAAAAITAAKKMRKLSK